MRFRFFFLLVLFFASCQDEYQRQILANRALKNEQFSNPATSPLSAAELPGFSELAFYPIDPKFKLKGSFQKSTLPRYFNLFEGTEVKQVHQQVGKVNFELDGKRFSLLAFSTIGQAKDQLFIPFRDETNQGGTYPGGRYLEALLLTDSTFMIDFNLAYNPFCAYNEKYTCAACPIENKLPVSIKAGELYQAH